MYFTNYFQKCRVWRWWIAQLARMQVISCSLVVVPSFFSPSLRPSLMPNPLAVPTVFNFSTNAPYMLWGRWSLNAKTSAELSWIHNFASKSAIWGTQGAVRSMSQCVWRSASSQEDLQLVPFISFWSNCYISYVTYVKYYMWDMIYVIKSIW